MELSMQKCLLKYFILDEELRSTCDFNPYLLEEGTGIYEVFRVVNGKPLFLKEHIDRFYTSAELGNIQIDIPGNRLIKMLQQLIEVNQVKSGNVQFQFIEHLNIGKKFIAWVTPTIYPTINQFTNGVNISTLQAVRETPNLKSVNLHARQLANNLIDEQDIFEALLINNDGLVTEGSRSNIFFVKDNQLFTPVVAQILPGITRSKVIELAFEERINIHTTHIPERFIPSYNAAFLTSTSMEILPIKSINDIHLGSQNELVNHLRSLYLQLIDEDVKVFSWSSET